MSHYDWLEENLPEFFENLGIEVDYHLGLITAHGDKCYGYQDKWAKNEIPFRYGVAIYLLSYMLPFSDQVRDTGDGWVYPDQWVIDNYLTFLPFFPKEKRRLPRE